MRGIIAYWDYFNAFKKLCKFYSIFESTKKNIAMYTNSTMKISTYESLKKEKSFSWSKRFLIQYYC